MKETEKENIIKMMDRLIKEVGRMIRKMVKENIITLMDQFIKDFRKIIKK